MTASIWAPNGFSPEVVPFDTFEFIAAGGQTVFSIAPYTAIYQNQLKVFKGSTATSGEILRTNQWDIVGTDIVLTSPCAGGEYVRIDVYSRNPSAGDELPAQAGNAGKFLRTDGTNPSWEDVPVGLPDQSGQAGKALFTDGTDPFWAPIAVPTTNTVFVQNVAALRLETKATLKSVATAGYYASNDGGSGLYVCDITDNTSPDNGATIIVGADGGRWKLQYAGALNVKQCGVRSDGTLTRAEFVAAFGLGISLWFPEGDYNIGSLSAYETVVTLANKYRLEFKGSNARITCYTSDVSAPRLFKLHGCGALKFSGFSITDTGFDRTGGIRRGIETFYLDNNITGCNNLVFERLFCEGVVTFLKADLPAVSRTRGITVDGVYVKNSYYGINLPGYVDALFVRNYVCDSVLRSYFIYGCSDHDVSVLSLNHPPSSADVLIKAYQEDTRRIKVWYTVKNSASDGPFVSIESQADGAPAIISDIEVYYDDWDATNPGTISESIVVRAYTLAGVPEGVTSKVFDKLKFKGASRKELGLQTRPDSGTRRIIVDDMILNLATVSTNKDKLHGWQFCNDDDNYFTVVKFGDLTATAIPLPFDRFNGWPLCANIRTVTFADSTLPNATARTVQEDVLHFANAGGGPVVVQQVDSVYKKFFTTASTTTYAGVAENLELAVTTYNGANAKLVTTFRFQ